MNPESTSSFIIYHNLDLTAVLIPPRAISCFASSRSSRLRIFPAALHILQLIIEQYTPEDTHLLGITSMTATPFEPSVEKKTPAHRGSTHLLSTICAWQPWALSTWPRFARKRSSRRLIRFPEVAHGPHTRCSRMGYGLHLISFLNEHATHRGNSVACSRLSTPITAASTMSGCISSTLSNSAGATVHWLSRKFKCLWHLNQTL